MPRPYDMRRRAAAAEDTRRRIIDAAHRLLADQNGGRLRVHEVARAAGVSRATLYNRVGPRRSLLAAVFRDQGRLIGYGRVQEAMADRDAVRALDATVRESCRAWSVIRVAIRRTLALAALDREVGRLVGRYEASRWAGLSGLVSRLGEQGALAPGIDNETRDGGPRSSHQLPIIRSTVGATRPRRGDGAVGVHGRRHATRARPPGTSTGRS